MKKFFKYSLIVFSVCFLLGMIAGSYYVYTVIQKTPRITKNKLISTNSTKIYDKYNHLLYASNFEQRNYVKYKDLPDNYKNALISTEDQSFWKNSGVNFKSTLYAVAGKLSGGRITDRGGSTITQQLIKLSVFSTNPNQRTVQRKIQEIWLAFQINHNFSKQQILEFYVNKIYEGNNVYGAQTISQLYFGKNLDKLTLSQAAIIAGLGQSPSAYNLYTNPNLVKKRRDQVLLAMYSNNKISKETYLKTKKISVTDGLVDQKLAIKKKDKKIMLGQSYITSVLDEAIANGYDVRKGSYKIYTNYDPKIQQEVTDILNNSNNYKSLNGIQAAAAVVNPNNGHVIAQVGGRNVNTLFGLNRATQTTRSSGSTIKPLLDYAPAVQYLHWGTDQQVSDTPYTYEGTNIQLHDWDRKYMGDMSMRRALALSRNVPAVRTLEALNSSGKSQAVVDMMRQLGINAKNYYGGSDAIGLNVSVAQMARAFSALDNGGTYYHYGYINRIVNADNISINTDDKITKAMKSSTAYIVTSMLTSVMNGEGNGAKYRVNNMNYQAGKTGTVQYDSSISWAKDYVSDGWFVGYTSPQASTNSGLVTAVWSGYDDPNVQGHGLKGKDQEVSTKVWQEIMNKLTQGQKNVNWQVPNGVDFVKGDKNDLNTAVLIPTSAGLKQPSANQNMTSQQQAEFNYWTKDGGSNVK